MNLFQLQKIKLNSGKESDFKIECDALTNEDWRCIAHLISKRVEPFCYVEGIPYGGQALAYYLNKYHLNSDSKNILIVDDVLTSGGSMERAKKEYREGASIIGAVAFARGKCPDWVTPLFQMT